MSYGDRGDEDGCEAAARGEARETCRVALIAGTARGDRANGIGMGASLARLKRGANRRASGLWVGRRLARGARYVYVVRGNRVRSVAVAAAPALRRVAGLRADCAPPACDAMLGGRRRPLGRRGDAHHQRQHP